LEKTIEQMEKGELKIRVRALESERSFKLMEIQNDNMATAIAASCMLNLGVLLSQASPAGELTRAAKAAFVLAGIFGIQIPIKYINLKNLQKKFAEFDG
jgi:hypothetical protein